MNSSLIRSIKTLIMILFIITYETYLEIQMLILFFIKLTKLKKV
jgi:hypothetical protein